MSSKNWNDSHKKERYEYNRKWFQTNKIRLRVLKKNWKKCNKDKTNRINKNSRLKLLYGITLEQFNQMLVSQDGRCGICAKPFKNQKDTCVDHDHNTGKIRQLLCFNCNIGIGKFGDSIILVEKALDYLNKWS